jgi:hypothetical protein
MTTEAAHGLSWEQALAWRMGRQHLVARAAPADFLRVVGEICGLHAQVMSSAELSLWARIDGLVGDEVQEALWQHRSLVKLWAMRGTLHLLPAAELGTWLAAIGTYTHYGNTYSDMDVLSEAVSSALDGRILTREELALAVERSTGNPQFGEWVRFSWGSYLKATTFRGLLCFASSENGRIRFTSPQDWVPGQLDRPDPAEALRAVTRRFLAAYAPFTAEDLARWWAGGAGPGKGARLLAALGEDAVEIEVAGQRAWALATDVPELTAAELPNVARLLPAFDPWVIGASRSNPVSLDPRYKARVYRAQGWISPVVLVNGRMLGVWRHERKGRRLLLTIQPFDNLPAWARPQVEAEAERLAAFLDCTLELSWA